MNNNIEMNKSKVNSVLKKLDSHNYDFNKEELFLITHEKILKDKVLSICMEDDDIWNYPVVECFRYEMKDDVDYFYKYVKKDIYEGIVSLTNNNIEWWEEDYLPSLRDLVLEKIKDPNYKIGKIKVPDSILKDVLDTIIECERYDDLNKMVLSGNQVDLEVFDKFMVSYEEGKINSFPYFNVNDIEPKVLLKKYGLKNIPLKFLDGLYEYSDYYDYNFFCEKIKTHPEEFYDYIDDSEALSNVLNSVDDDKKRNLITSFLENNYFEPFLTYDFLNDYITEEDIDKIASAILERKDSINNGNLFSYNVDNYNNVLLSNDKIISSFIKVGNFSAAFLGHVDFYEYKTRAKRFEKEIVNAIDNYDGKIDETEIDLFGFGDSVEIIKALIRQDPSLRTLSYIFSSDMYDETCEISDMIDNILLNSDSSEIKYVPNCKSLVYKLLKNKKYELFSDICVDYYMDKEFSMELLKSFKDGNLFFINCMLENNSSILDDNNFLDVILFNKYFAETVIDVVLYLDDDKYYTDDFYDFYREYIANDFSLDIDVLDKVKEVFGVSVLKEFSRVEFFNGTSNVERLFEFEEEELNKFLGLFSSDSINIHDVEAIYDALKQYQFSLKFPDIMNMYSNVLSAIENNDYGNVERMFSSLKKTMDSRFFDLFKERYEDIYKIVGSNKEYLLTYVVGCIKNGVDSADLLHFITNYYIASKREDYRNNSDMIKDLDLPYTFRTKDVKNFFAKDALMKNLSVGDVGIRDYIKYIMMREGMDSKLIDKCIDYYIGDSSVIDDDIKRNMPLLIKSLKTTLNKCYNYEFQENYTKMYENDTLDKIPLVDDIDNNYKILKEINMPFVSHYVLNSDYYDELVNIIRKYKLNRIPDGVGEMLSRDGYDLKWNSEVLAKFINFYPKILYNLEKNNHVDLSIIDVFINSNMYYSETEFYKNILGDKSYYLIKTNPSPNSASMSCDDRLSCAAEYVGDSFKRVNSPVPSFNEVIESASGKKVRVIVGNFNHEENVVYGELDGSCFRIGGVEDKFFDFCFRHREGFFIRFEDPITGKYISRVSCFRNKNIDGYDVVACNQLRFSQDPNIKNDDLIDIAYKAMRKIGEYSKESDYPISHVVIAAQKALGEKDSVKLPFDIKEGLPFFPSDINSYGIIVYTDPDFKKTDYNKSGYVEYLPARCEIEAGRYLENEINRVHSVKAVLEDPGIALVKPLEFDEEIKYTICNKDWYICVDLNDNVYGEVIDLDKRALIEFRENYDKVIDKFDIKKSDNKIFIKK